MKIELKNIKFSYEEEINVLDDLSLTINEGEMVAILGHNGSGKSTLSKIIMGLLEPNSGSVIINDQEYTGDEFDKVRDKMGIIFQNPDNQFVGVTVQDDIAFGLENRRIERSEMIERINKYSKVVNMEEYLLTNPENLSGGQKQRVAIAGVLAMETEVIIFDESTSMLDPKGTKEINEMIKKLKEIDNKTIISITHNLEEAVYADRVIVLNNGKIVLDGTPKEVLKNKAILEASGLKLLDGLEIINDLNESNIKINPSISRDELSKRLNISVRQVRKIIDQLRNDGVLTRQGGDAGRWIIHKNNMR